MAALKSCHGKICAALKKLHSAKVYEMVIKTTINTRGLNGIGVLGREETNGDYSGS